MYVRRRDIPMTIASKAFQVSNLAKKRDTENCCALGNFTQTSFNSVPIRRQKCLLLTTRTNNQQTRQAFTMATEHTRLVYLMLQVKLVKPIADTKEVLKR